MRTTKSALTPACNQLAQHADMSGSQTVAACKGEILAWGIICPSVLSRKPKDPRTITAPDEPPGSVHPVQAQGRALMRHSFVGFDLFTGPRRRCRRTGPTPRVGDEDIVLALDARFDPESRRITTNPSATPSARAVKIAPRRAIGSGYRRARARRYHLTPAQCRAQVRQSRKSRPPIVPDGTGGDRISCLIPLCSVGSLRFFGLSRPVPARMNFLCRSIRIQRSINAKRCSAEPFLLYVANRDCAVVSACRNMMLHLFRTSFTSSANPFAAKSILLQFQKFEHRFGRAIRRVPIHNGNSFGLPSVTCLNAIPLCCAPLSTFVVFGSPRTHLTAS